MSDEELHQRLEELQAAVDADPDELADAVAAAREETAARTFEQS